MLLAFRPSLFLLVATWAASLAIASPRVPSLRDPHVSSASDPKGVDSVQASPPVVAVADFRATMLSRTEADALAEGFCAALAADRRLRVVDRNAFAGLRNSNDFGPLSQCTQLSCALELGRQAQSDVVVLGEVSKTKKGLSLGVRLVDVPLRIVQENIETKVYPGAEELRTRGIPELVSRLLDTARRTSEAIDGQSLNLDTGGRKVESIPVRRNGRIPHPETDTGTTAERTMDSRSAIPRAKRLDLGKITAYGAAVSGGLLVGSIAVLGLFPVCADRGDDTEKDGGECLVSLLNVGYYLYQAGIVVGYFTLATGALAIVQRFIPAKPEAQTHRRLVLVPRIDPSTSTWGLATRLDF